MRGRHSFKAGFDLQFVADDRVQHAAPDLHLPERRRLPRRRKSGVTNPRAYTTFQQDLGDPSVSYNSGFHALFVQDDFRVSSSFKLLFGVRYDLFDIPDARPFAANPLSQSTSRRTRTTSPRGWASPGASTAAARTVLRASTGIMYEPPLLNFYEDAILRNGDPRSFTATLNPTSAGAPAFPATLADLPPGFALPDAEHQRGGRGLLDSQWTIMTNVQIERALGEDFSVSLGYVNSTGRNMPVLIDTNIIPDRR